MSSQQQKTKGVVDMVFLIDATGSMGDCIDALKTNIETFVGTLTAKNANNASPVKEWRAKAVGYRDFQDDSAPPFVDNAFVDNVEAFTAQLAALQAVGGGDEPESLLEALYKVATMPATEKGETLQPDRWRYRSAALRAVVVFTDATFKEKMVEPPGATKEDVFNSIEQNKIVLSVFAPELPGFEGYRELSELDKAEWRRVTGGATPQESLRAFTTDQANFKNTLMQLAKTVSASAAAEPLV